MKPIAANSLLLLSQSVLCLPAMAQNAFSVPMEVVHVSNPDLAAESRGSVTLYRIHPQYTLQLVQDSARTELSLGAMIERSSNTDLSANRSLPSVRVNWTNSSPVSVFGLQASLEEASTRETEFAEFGRVARDSKSRTGSVGTTWAHNFSAEDSLELAATHARVSYDSDLFIPYRESRGAATYGKRVGPNTRYSLSASVSRLNTDVPELDANRGEIGVGYQTDLREGLTLNVGVGAVRTTGANPDTDPVASLRLEYTGERVGYAVSLSREVSAGGSLGGYSRSQGFDASMTYPLSVNTTLSLGVGHTKSLEAESDAGAIVFARLRSELSRFWAFTVGLEHRRAMPAVGPTGRGNSVAVGLVYSHPDF